MEFERQERRPVNLTVRLREGERAAAEQAAERAGVTLSELARAALRDATQKVLAGQP